MDGQSYKRLHRADGLWCSTWFTKGDKGIGITYMVEELI